MNRFTVRSGLILRSAAGAMEVKIAAQKKEVLLRLIKGLHVEFGLERSFKVLPGILLTNRFLLSLFKGAVPRDKLLDLCQELGLPGYFREPLLQGLPDAKASPFRLRRERNGIDLQGLSRNERKEPPLPVSPLPGLQMQISHPDRGSLARYTCYPSFTLKTWWKGCLLPSMTRTLRSLLHSKLILGMAADITSEILFLDVAEDNNKRSLSI